MLQIVAIPANCPVVKGCRNNLLVVFVEYPHVFHQMHGALVLGCKGLQIRIVLLCLVNLFNS